MGASQSTNSQHHPPSKALHVLRVTPSSPASQTNIEPFFDFVVGFEGDSLSQATAIDVAQLEKIVEQHEGRTLNLLVWSSKSRKTRVIPIQPSRGWSQSAHLASTSASQPSLLGLSMRMCEPETATENVWHVLDVIEGSPAESAGLVPMGDWILGWSGGVLGAENDFYDLVEAINRSEIPPQPEDRLPGSTPIELQEAEEEYEDQELFVPADVHSEVRDWRRQEQEQWNQEPHHNFHHNRPGMAYPSDDPSEDHEHDHHEHEDEHGHHEYDHNHEFGEGDHHKDHDHVHGHSGHSHTPNPTHKHGNDISRTPAIPPFRVSMDGDSRMSKGPNIPASQGAEDNAANDGGEISVVDTEKRPQTARQVSNG
ncbi:hypothetical protein C0995_004694 [Termitomyces sp. Mi166|nr:hypothetical protein C0995_004694 [Termitomyces sp. Mi166\